MPLTKTRVVKWKESLKLQKPIKNSKTYSLEVIDVVQGLRIPDNLFATIPDAPWIISRRKSPVGDIPRVGTELNWQDVTGSWKARWGINRMNFNVVPGLYCVGEPDDSSPVFVTANYKMTFDRVRKALAGMSAWILVLDTRGINVWCAAGKGTFGTAELIRRIALAGLGQIVSHRTIIVPQLGATGVAAHEVRKQTGFKVIYGPVRAEDISAFVTSGMKATREMRRIKFDFYDRLVLTPVELTGLRKPLLIIMLAFIFTHITGIFKITLLDLYAFMGAILVGAVITPVLLPWIPGRAFSFKGWLLGMLWAVLVINWGAYLSRPHGLWVSLSQILILPAISAFLALQFTGASTFTSLSGVKKEMKVAMPVIIISTVLGLATWLAGRFI